MKKILLMVNNEVIGILWPDKTNVLFSNIQNKEQKLNITDYIVEKIETSIMFDRISPDICEFNSKETEEETKEEKIIRLYKKLVDTEKQKEKIYKSNQGSLEWKNDSKRKWNLYSKKCNRLQKKIDTLLGGNYFV